MRKGNCRWYRRGAKLLVALVCLVPLGCGAGGPGVTRGMDDLPAPAAETIMAQATGGTPVLTDSGANVVNVRRSSMAWGDYDNDGDMDLVIAGDNGTDYVTKIYRNDGNGAFTDIGANLIGVRTCALAWGDYDNDGDLDFVLTGANDIGSWGKVFRNNGNSWFQGIGGMVRGVHESSVAWGDYDNDGDLDLAAAGVYFYTTFHYLTTVYRNDGDGVLADTGVSLPGLFRGAVAWVDYDNDGDLDLAVTGEWEYAPAQYMPLTRIYRNDGATPNARPAAPTGLAAAVFGDNVTFSWNAAADAETLTAGLSYNLRVGTTPGGGEIVSGQADAATGARRLPAMGNVQVNRSWTLRGLTPGRYYWSVQAIDSGFAASPWVAERRISTLPPIPGDADRDGTVSFADFAILQNHYGQSVIPNTSGDFTNDGIVTFEDFSILQNNYGAGGDP